MTQQPEITFGLVGCGRIAVRYANLLTGTEIKGARLVAVCDNQADRATAFAEKYTVPAFTDMHQMMADACPDVVVVLTPSGLHASHVINLARHGRPIIVEKPMALTTRDAAAMMAACEQHSVPLYVVKQNRFNLPVMALHHALDAGRFGRLVMGTVRVRWCRPQAYYDQDPWRGTWAMDGGVFSNQASHHVDLLAWIFGPVKSVFARTAKGLAEIEAEDTGVAVITFQSGAIGIIEATTATRPKDLEGSLTVMGERATVEIGGFAVNALKTWNFADHGPADAEMLKRYSENPPDVYGFGHRRYLEQVLQSLRNGTPPPVATADGRMAVELVEAIYESAARGAEVTFPVKPQLSRLGEIVSPIR